MQTSVAKKIPSIQMTNNGRRPGAIYLYRLKKRIEALYLYRPIVVYVVVVDDVGFFALLFMHMRNRYG